MPRLAARRAAVLAISLGTLVAAPSAQGRFSDQDAAESLAVAHSFWHKLDRHAFKRPGVGCRRGSVRIDWRRDMGSAMAWADVGGCRSRDPEIELERRTVRRLSDLYACGVVVHEYGHLLGFRHVRNPRKLMSGGRLRGERPPRRATWRRAWRRCAAAGLT